MSGHTESLTRVGELHINPYNSVSTEQNYAEEELGESHAVEELEDNYAEEERRDNYSEEGLREKYAERTSSNTSMVDMLTRICTHRYIKTGRKSGRKFKTEVVLNIHISCC